MNLHSAWLNNSHTGMRSRITNYQIALVLIHQERVLGALGIFTTLVGGVVLIFLCYQFYLIFSGKTANESFKWDDLEEIIMDRELWVCDDLTKFDKLQKNKKKSNGKEVTRGNTTAVYWIQPKDIRQRQNIKEGEGGDGGETSVSSSNGKREEHARSAANSQIGRRVKSISEVKNIYNKGLLVNIREAFFPPSL
ncbi:15522_t:CDS:2 [Acaulospora morrowiae]|uniref:15522_t:CDS:1 n=1 Tax=Acaulospora morrowiae TaxID=94023 RepID=A0A9N8YPB7_9GLOM|nr:15522_t:CDS:2 [Acaulospora morrowiae]